MNRGNPKILEIVFKNFENEICTIRDDKIRIISARKATKQEVNDYAKGI